jgi:hypothetical protein
VKIIINDDGYLEYIHQGKKIPKQCVKDIEHEAQKVRICGVWCACCNESKVPVQDTGKKVVGLADIIMITCGKVPFNIEIDKPDIAIPKPTIISGAPGGN